MKHVILFLFMSLPVFLRANGEPSKTSVSITGVVYESGSVETLPGVKVLVTGTDIFTYTDKDGKFELPVVPTGNYQLTFSLVSFNSTQLPLQLIAGQNSDIAVSLETR